MAQSPVFVTVKYSSPGTQPPVYVAGSFSGWEPQEMQYTTDTDNEHVFHKEIEVEQGKEYQYKFRLGPGDWWVLNETAPTSTDNIGNRNNLLSAPKQPSIAKESEMISITPAETMATKAEHADLGTSSSETKLAEEPQSEEVAESASSRDPRTPDAADVAAEVADSAATMDTEEPEPIVSDVEAGQVGLRRLSNTPIPDVAKTAAEVADVAAIIDKNHTFDLPPTPTESEVINGTTDSDTVTPWEERAPLFAHECVGTDTTLYPQARYQTEPLTPTTSNEEAVAIGEVDFNDPTLEQFPHDHRTSILERVRTVESRLDEDKTNFEGTPLSPVVSPHSPVNGSNRSPERPELPSISPALLDTEQNKSPSLSSITEEHCERQDEASAAASLTNNHGEPELLQLNHDEEEAPVSKEVSEPSMNIQEVSESLPESSTRQAKPAPDSSSPPEQTSNGLHKEPEVVLPTTTNEDSGDEENHIQEIGTGNEGPSITVHPATPSSSEPILKNPVDEATSTGIEQENGHSNSQLTSRKQPSPNERSITPVSLSSEHAAKSQNFLKAFWKVVFVDWFGGLITRLCGGRRHTLLAISALLILGIAPALYLRA